MTYGELLARLYELSPDQLGDEVLLIDSDEDPQVTATIGTVETVNGAGGKDRLVLHLQYE